MKKALQVIAILALLVVIVPPVLYLAGTLEKDVMSGWMLAGTIGWFVAAPLARRFDSSST